MMNNIEYLIGAYALIWLVLAYYFYASGTKLKQLEEKVKILEDEKEIKEAIEKLAVKYHPKDNETNRNQTIIKEWNLLCMIEFSIEHITGKEAIELVKSRTQHT